MSVLTVVLETFPLCHFVNLPTRVDGEDAIRPPANLPLVGERPGRAEGVLQLAS